MLSKMQEELLAACGLKPEDAMPKANPQERLENMEQRQDKLEVTQDDIILMMADLIGG